MILLATETGLLTVSGPGDRQPRRLGLEGQRLTCLAAQGPLIVAGTRQGLYRSGDGGRTWQQPTDGIGRPHARWLAVNPDDPRRVFLGTEPAAIFASADGGETWQEAPEVARLRDRLRWFLPYSPEAGCVRGFAFHGERAYAAVEVGGVLRSGDTGKHWDLVKGSDGSPRLGDPPAPQVHPDVHSILVHPNSPDLVLAPTGGGFYRSQDGGDTWQLLYDCYCRAAWADPQDPAHLVLGPADNVDRNGRIEESRDGGATWLPASQNLSVPWPRHMVERFIQAGESLYAVLSNGDLLWAPLATLEWSAPLAGTGRVNAVAVSEDGK